jgi:hypothetical protein
MSFWRKSNREMSNSGAAADRSAAHLLRNPVVADGVPLFGRNIDTRMELP